MVGLLSCQHTNHSKNVHPPEVVSFLCLWFLAQLKCEVWGNNVWYSGSVEALRKITCSLPGLHICKQQCCREGVCLTYSVCKTTTLKGKVWWKGLHFLDEVSVRDQPVAPLPPYVLSSCMGLVWHHCLVTLKYYLPFCLVLSPLPVLGCCVSPYFSLVKFGGQREVGSSFLVCGGFLGFVSFLFVLLPSLMGSPLG